MTVKTDLLNSWTAKAMERARVVESDQPTPVRAAARAAYRAYSQGIDDLHSYPDQEVVETKLRRRMRNPLLLARHATYGTMLADLALARDLADFTGGETW
ncbi:hypothetical protein GCM10027447_01930 [Glycomyces halotolerans]